MRIALVADIHSNHIAFDAVLQDINKQNIDLTFFLGDYVFSGYGSNETVDFLKLQKMLFGIFACLDIITYLWMKKLKVKDLFVLVLWACLLMEIQEHSI